MNKHATIDDTVFSMWPLLGNGAVNMSVATNEHTTVEDPLEAVSSMWSVPMLYRLSHEERSMFWKVTVSVILNKKVYMYMCPILNGFRERAISLYCSKIVGKRDI
jgi:hypothetical protein